MSSSKVDMEGKGKRVGSRWKNNSLDRPRLMDLRWLLISAAVVINYKPAIQILLYLVKFVIYIVLLARRFG